MSQAWMVTGIVNFEICNNSLEVIIFFKYENEGHWVDIESLQPESEGVVGHLVGFYHFAETMTLLG